MRLVPWRIVSLVVRRCAERAGSSAPRLAAAAGCTLVLALTGCSRLSGTATAVPPTAGATTYPHADEPMPVRYRRLLPQGGLPGGVRRHWSVSVKRIRTASPSMRLVAVTSPGSPGRPDITALLEGGLRRQPLPCVHPGGRGLFGDAVLTKAAIESGESGLRGPSRPRAPPWLCVSTRAGVDVCTSHLASPEIVEVAANDPQCTELRALLARRRPPHRRLRGRREPSLLLRPPWLLDPNRPFRLPGSRKPAGLWKRRAPVALGGGGAGHTRSTTTFSWSVRTSVRSASRSAATRRARLLRNDRELATRPSRSQSLHSRWAPGARRALGVRSARKCSQHRR